MTHVHLTDLEFDFIRQFVADRAAISLESDKRYLVESRLAPIVRDHNLPSLQELVRRIQRGGSAVLTRQVIEAMTTHETSFFRDQHPFDALRNEVIPDVMCSNRGNRTLAIWSNACSSGQEIYSIAMLLKESFPELRDWKVRLIASDISRRVLDRAREGVFNQTEISRGLPPELLRRYFTQHQSQWRIAEELRQMVEFMPVNLIEPFPHLPPIDVVFLRNVLIYFTPDTKGRILNRVSQVLSPNGYLFLGGGETTLNLDVPFRRHQNGKLVCYRPVNLAASLGTASAR